MNLLIEKLIEGYRTSYGVRSTTLRLANVYGPRQWESGIIPSTILRVLRGNAPHISGDGKETLDFVFVDDVAGAFIKAGATEKEGIFNVGTTTEITLTDTVELIARELDWKGGIEYEPWDERKGARSSLDRSKIQKEFGWEPVTPFQSGIKKTVEWFRDKS